MVLVVPGAFAVAQLPPPDNGFSSERLNWSKSGVEGDCPATRPGGVVKELMPLPVSVKMSASAPDPVNGEIPVPVLVNTNARLPPPLNGATAEPESTSVFTPAPEAVNGVTAAPDVFFVQASDPEPENSETPAPDRA